MLRTIDAAGDASNLSIRFGLLYFWAHLVRFMVLGRMAKKCILQKYSHVLCVFLQVCNHGAAGADSHSMVGQFPRLMITVDLDDF